MTTGLVFKKQTILIVESYVLTLNKVTQEDVDLGVLSDIISLVLEISMAYFHSNSMPTVIKNRLMDICLGPSSQVICLRLRLIPRTRGPEV